jgi:lysyl endopeptidase
MMNKSLAVIAFAVLSATSVFAAVTEQVSSIPTAVTGQQLSAPQAIFESKKAAVIERFVSNAPTAHVIDVGAYKAADSVKSSMSKRGDFDKRTALQIGFPREIPTALRTLPLALLPWQSQSDGGRAVKVEVFASEAAGIRVGYRFEGPTGGAQLRFAGSTNPEVFKVDAATSSEIHWSPTMEGDHGTIEMRVLPGFEPSAFKLVLEQLSHLKNVGAGLALLKAARDPGLCPLGTNVGIGCSESCNIDVACVVSPSQGLLNIARATARIFYTDNGSTYVCSGTLLNSNPQTNRPYFFTASHCINNQASASSLESYWFFDAVACGSTSTPLSQRVTGGATLLVTDSTMDVTLLQMNTDPPNGAVLAGWDATVIPTNAVVVSMHHPGGDLKAYSQGLMQGYGRGPQFDDQGQSPYYLRDSYIKVRWEQGTTEQGSSGAGIFTFNQSNGTYSLRGGLEGGGASCSNPSGIDRYSRMDFLFAKLSPYLQPSAIVPPSNSVISTMVEYYRPDLNYYFMTSREPEKNLLNTYRDNNQNLVFYPTGNSFKTDSTASPSTSSVIRYFNAASANQNQRGLHFYTASNADKQALSASGLERFPAQGCPDRFWCNEGIDSYVNTPINPGVNGTCPVGLTPIYRSFRRNFDDGTHRFLPSAGMYQYVLSGNGMGELWDPEGVAFCARP